MFCIGSKRRLKALVNDNITRSASHLTNELCCVFPRLICKATEQRCCENALRMECSAELCRQALPLIDKPPCDKLRYRGSSAVRELLGLLGRTLGDRPRAPPRPDDGTSPLPCPSQATTVGVAMWRSVPHRHGTCGTRVEPNPEEQILGVTLSTNGDGE